MFFLHVPRVFAPQLWQHVAALSVQCHQLLVRLPRIVRTARFIGPDSRHCLRGVVVTREIWGVPAKPAYWGLSPSPFSQKSTQKQEQLAASPQHPQGQWSQPRVRRIVVCKNPKQTRTHVKPPTRKPGCSLLTTQKGKGPKSPFSRHPAWSCLGVLSSAIRRTAFTKRGALGAPRSHPARSHLLGHHWASRGDRKGADSGHLGGLCHLSNAPGT